MATVGALPSHLRAGACCRHLTLTPVMVGFNFCSIIAEKMDVRSFPATPAHFLLFLHLNASPQEASLLLPPVRGGVPPRAVPVRSRVQQEGKRPCGAMWCPCGAMRCPCGAHVVPCGAHVVPMRCPCGAHVVPCGAHVVPCGAHVVPMWCPCGAHVVLMLACNLSSYADVLHALHHSQL